MADVATHVLLIESDPADAARIRAAFEDAQSAAPEVALSLGTADGLGSGVARLGEGGVHVVLLSLDLPDGQGLDALHRVRALATTRPVIVLSRRTDRAVVAQALRQGAQDHLAKSDLDGDRLLRSLRYALACMQGDLDRAARAQAEARATGLERRLEALVVGEARARRLYEAGILGVVLWTREGRITDANDAFLRLVGHTRADLDAGALSWSTMTPPEFHDLDARALAELDAGGAFAPFEKEYLHRDGHRVPVLLAGATWEGSGAESVAWVLDMSARKRAEAEAEGQRHRLRTILMQAPAAFAVLRGPDHVYELSNAVNDRLVGHPVALGRPAREAAPELAAQGLLALLDRVYQTGEPFVGAEVPLRLQPVGAAEVGEAFVNGMYQPLRDAGGRIEGVLAFAYEVTDQVLARRRAESLAAELKASEEQFRTLAESMPLLAWYAEPDGSITWYNRRWHEYTGLPLAEQEGWKWRAVHDPADVERVTAKWRHSLATGEPFEDEFRLRRHDGVWRWFLTRVVPVRGADGRIARWLGTNVEIDAQKRAAIAARLLDRASTALAGSLDLARTLASVARLVVPEWAEWSCVYLREGAGPLRVAAAAHRDPARVAILEMLAERHPHPPEAPRGPAWVVRTGEPELIPEVTDAMRRETARDPEQLAQWRALGATSSLIVPLVVQGEAVGALALARAGAMAPFEAADVPLYAELGRRVAVAIDNAQLFEAVRRERRRAEEANRTKDEFLAVTSHELRTPLTAILGWSRLLRLGAVPEDGRDRALETIERNARAQAQLIEDILDVSRIMTGKFRLDVAPVDLGPVVEAAVEVVRPAADAKGVRLQVLLDPAAGVVHGDAARLQQVAWNLLANAVKFTPRGGRVYVRLQRAESQVELTVADSGRGVAPAFLPHLFEPFQQADGSTTRAHGGLGLGLAIVKHLVELHGGTIEAASEGEGRGATFTVRVPMASLQCALTAAPPDPLAPPTRPVGPPRCPPEVAGLRVLVVEDSRDARDLIRAILEQCGAAVTTAASAAEALALFRRDPPDVLLSDIGMPDEDGYALVRAVRALPAERGGRTPAVALTAYARREDRIRALREGFTDHVSKPIEPQDLLTVLAAAVGRHGGTV